MYARFGKPLFDVLLSLVALVVLGPVIAAVAVVVRLKLGRPVLFRQQRPGLRGQTFELVKFRTMSDERDPLGNLLSDEQRLGRFGRLLRSTSLDELPELWNVLCGDMSFVGPRPLLIRYLDRYSPEQARRHDVRPGITGLAQVSGRNAISWDQKFTFDLDYVDRLSFLLDIEILLKTVLQVLRRDGVTASGEATMYEFQPTQPDLGDRHD